MNIVWFLVPAALLMGAGFLVLFVVAGSRGQFEDLETPAVRILLEDQVRLEKEKPHEHG
jgi:cbb3-type cytochrome oxidase maturation protein